MHNQPRPVTQEAIDAFECQYPLYRGIGRLMIQEGVWALAERNDSRKNGGPVQQLSRTVTQAANSSPPCEPISMPCAGGGAR